MTDPETRAIPVDVVDRKAARPWLHQYLNGSDLSALAEAFARHRITALETLAAENARLREAVEPSGDTKAAYHGEFAFELFDGVSDAGVDQHRKVYVPWDTVKQIMAAIRDRAALSPVTPVKESGR